MARKKAPPIMAPEWSFPVEADKVQSNPMKLVIKANPEARKHVAKRVGVLSVDMLEANLLFSREPGRASIHVTGTLNAMVQQECVVSGQPIEEKITEEFDAWYADLNKTVLFAKARHDKSLKKGGVEMPILDESEDPEPIIDGYIDAGELVTQYLSLALNPYPHAEGVKYELGDDNEEAIKPKLDNPFAALKEWKNNKKEN